MVRTCDDCALPFANRPELEKHRAMVHDAKWSGNINQSENGDLEADGAISPLTSDTVATRGGLDRPDARQRAAVMQGRTGEGGA